MDKNGNKVEKYLNGANVDEVVSFAKTNKIVGTSDPLVQTFYPMTDHLGSVALLADENAAIAEYYTYSSFGKATAFNSNREKTNNFTSRHLFTGREYIPQIDLYDYRNRFYSADLGRFLQTDPIGFSAGDVNLYRYVGNFVSGARDPWGLEMSDECCCQKAKENADKGAQNRSGNKNAKDGRWGMVVCCNGKAISCSANKDSWPGDDQAKELIEKCVKKHEDNHIKNGAGKNCKSGMNGEEADSSSYQSESDFHKEEMEEHKKSGRCLARAKKKCKTQACRDGMDEAISNASGGYREHSAAYNELNKE